MFRTRARLETGDHKLQFADYLITGGIVAYDSGITSGGIGATYLGIGPSVNFRRDLISLNLRLVSITDGTVLRSINSSRTVYSINPTVNVTRYVSVGNLLEVQAGVTVAEGTQVAVREAVEAAVLELIREGQATKLWSVNPKDTVTLGGAPRVKLAESSNPPEHPPEAAAQQAAAVSAGAPTKPNPEDPLFKLRVGQH